MKYPKQIASTLSNFFLFFNILIFPVPFLQSQTNWGLNAIIAGPYDVPSSPADQSVLPSYLEKTPEGGILEVTVRNKIRGGFCNSKYRFEWKFSKPMEQLKEGEAFNLEYQANLAGGNCQNADARMIASSSTGFSSQYKTLGIKGGTSGISFPDFKIPNEKWVYTIKRYAANTARGKVKPWGGNYATIRLNFESQNLWGSDRFHFEVVYVFQKNHQSTIIDTVSEFPACPNYNSWYWPAEDNHPWQGLNMHQLRQMGHREDYYYSSSTEGGSYFLPDPNGNIVRVHGSKIFYVNWSCFEKHWEYVRRQDLFASKNLSYANIYRRRDTGSELVINFLKK